MRYVFIFLLLLTPLATIHAIDYQTLAPIDGFVGQTETIGGDNDLGAYLNNIFRLGIALAGGLAVLMIIIGGVQYVSSDAWSKKSDGRERITQAVFGLLIALGSWVLLNTINPDLLDTELELQPVNLEAIYASLPEETQKYISSGNTGESGSGTPGQAPTGQMANIPDGVAVKPGAGTQIDSSMARGLQNMNTELNAAGIQWRVTEGYPPTRVHKADCHKNGTCIDANFTNGASPEKVKRFIEIADRNGFRAVYEVKTENEKKQLVAAGVPENRVKNLGGWISGNHFSVYNN